MFNANDYNLEETSKNAAEQFSDKSLIPDWQQLEKKLDIELPVKKKRRRFAAIWFLFTVLFIGSFYFTNLLIIPKAALFLLLALLLTLLIFCSQTIFGQSKATSTDIPIKLTIIRRN